MCEQGATERGGVFLCVSWGCSLDSPAHPLGSFSCSQVPAGASASQCHPQAPPAQAVSPATLRPSRLPQGVHPQDGLALQTLKKGVPA